jgi:hypothetical protein
MTIVTHALSEKNATTGLVTRLLVAWEAGER